MSSVSLVSGIPFIVRTAPTEELGRVEDLLQGTCTLGSALHGKCDVVAERQHGRFVLIYVEQK